MGNTAMGSRWRRSEIRIFGGDILRTWRLYCDDCVCQCYCDSETEPTQCPTCSGANISDIMQCDCDCGYISRGDPVAWDFTVEDFTCDNAWHDLDLSSIIPEEAKGKLLHLLFTQEHVNNPNARVDFRQKGQSNQMNTTRTRQRVPGVSFDKPDGFILCDSNGVVQYRTTGTPFAQINLSIRGWLL